MKGNLSEVTKLLVFITALTVSVDIYSAENNDPIKNFYGKDISLYRGLITILQEKAQAFATVNIENGFVVGGTSKVSTKEFFVDESIAKYMSIVRVEFNMKGKSFVYDADILKVQYSTSEAESVLSEDGVDVGFVILSNDYGDRLVLNFMAGKIITKEKAVIHWSVWYTTPSVQIIKKNSGAKDVSCAITGDSKDNNAKPEPKSEPSAKEEPKAPTQNEPEPNKEGNGKDN